MKAHNSTYRSYRAHRLSSCWWTSTTLTPAGKVALLKPIIGSPTRLHLMITNAGKLTADIKTCGRLGCSDHTQSWRIWIRRGLKSGSQILRLLGRRPSGTKARKRAGKCVRRLFLRVQGKKSSKRLACLDLLAKIRSCCTGRVSRARCSAKSTTLPSYVAMWKWQCMAEAELGQGHKE